MARADIAEAGGFVESLSKQVSKHGFTTVVAVALIAQMMWMNQQLLEKFERLTVATSEMTRAISEIQRQSADIAKTLDRVTVRLEHGSGR